MVGSLSSPTHVPAESSLTMSGKHKKHGERSVMSPFRKQSSMKNDRVMAETGKKSEGGQIPARYGGKRPALTKSSSAYFPHSTTTSTAAGENGGPKTPQKSASVGRSAVSSLKGIWKRNSRKKTSLKFDTEDIVDVGSRVSEHQSPSRELPRRLSLRRKNSVSGDKVCVLMLTEVHNYVLLLFSGGFRGGFFGSAEPPFYRFECTRRRPRASAQAQSKHSWTAEPPCSKS